MLFVERVVRFADTRPLPALQRYCRSLPGELPERLGQLDDICEAWIRFSAEADARTDNPSDPTYIGIRNQHVVLVSQVIDRFLAASKDNVLEGITEDYG